ERDGANDADEDIGREENVNPWRRTRAGDEPLEVRGPDPGLQVSPETELDVRRRKPGGIGQDSPRLLPERISGARASSGRRKNGKDAAGALIASRTARRAGARHGSAISAAKNEHPRGGASLIRPRSSTPPPAARPRSAVWTASTLSTLAKSSKRRMP